MCAVKAQQRGRKVLVVEQGAEVGRKIFLSGGGRCNFTNRYTSPENFISANPRFPVSALARFTQDDFIALVDKHEIQWHERKFAQLFCLGSAKQIIDMLLAEAKGADIRTAVAIKKVEKE